MKPPIVNLDDVETRSWSRGETHGAEFRSVGMHIGSRMLGYNVATIPPGRIAVPYHAHYANEEMFFVLDGTGSIRIDGETYPLRTGDFVNLPPGPDSAHQIINDSDAPLRYLSVSTMVHPEVVTYPDSGKVGFMAGCAPGRRDDNALVQFHRASGAVDYWADED